MPFKYGQDIVMAFSPPVVGCLVKKGLQKGGGGHGHARTPLATPLPERLAFIFLNIVIFVMKKSFTNTLNFISIETFFIKQIFQIKEKKYAQCLRGKLEIREIPPRSCK